jgi:hypothetical protein
MTKQVHYIFTETIRYTDGTPTSAFTGEGAMLLRNPLPLDETDKECLKQWVANIKKGSGESRIQDFLFRYRKDPKHKRSKYESITFEVLDAWIVEYP